MKDAHLLSDEQIAALTREEALEASQDLHNWHGFGYADGRTAVALMNNPKLHAEVLRARNAVDKRLGRCFWQIPFEKLKSHMPRSAHLRCIRKALIKGETVPAEVLAEYTEEELHDAT